jgi:glutaredoxin-like YruB-family protein
MAKKVKIYSTPYCTYCKLAKNFFTKNKIDFTEVDVSEDEKELNSMVKKSGQMGVPVIEIDDKVIVGYNEAKIKKLLGLK